MTERGGRVGVIVQARMGSSRLPGKAMLPMAGRPMIAWVMDRLARMAEACVVVLATSTEDREAPLVAWARAHGVNVFRGDENDVLDRFVACMDLHNLDAVVRATGDNPFVDPVEADRLVALYRRSDVDYASSLGCDGSGLPVGVGLEVMRACALRTSWHEGNEPHHREHVNEYIREQPERFSRQLLVGLPQHQARELSLTVDTPLQFAEADDLFRTYLESHKEPVVPLSWVVHQHLAPRVVRGAA